VLKKQIREVAIEFKPPNYGRGQVAQIMGDFTDWIPVNMRMYTVEEQMMDDRKAGLFFIKLRLIKGFRYKYRYVYRDSEVVDHDPQTNVTVSKDGIYNNYLEVAADDTRTVADFL